MNRTIIRLTARGLLGGRRLLLVLALALLLVALAIVLRVFAEPSDGQVAEFLRAVSLGAVMPLFGLIVGTGVLGPEIDDGSVVYLLSKPLPRSTIILSKLAVAVAATLGFAVIPTVLAAAVMTGGSAGITVAFGVGAFVAGTVYCVIFMLLTVVTRHAVVLGLVYALGWESLVGSFIPGARNLSVQQWALSVTESLSEPGVLAAHVGLASAIALAVAVFVGGTWLASQRLRVLNLTAEE